MCGAVYSTSLLGDGVRERQPAVASRRRSGCSPTCPPASTASPTAGRVTEGWWADLVVFDPERVGPGPMRTRDDLPGGASRLYADATGIEHVLVNGTEVVTADRLTGALPGRVLRSGDRHPDRPSLRTAEPVGAGRHNRQCRKFGGRVDLGRSPFDVQSEAGNVPASRPRSHHAALPHMIRIDEQNAPAEGPSPELMERMGALFEEITKAGVMLDTAGLTPTSEGTRVTWSGGKLSAHRRALHRDQGSGRRLRHPPGQGQGRGPGVDQAVPPVP